MSDVRGYGAQGGSTERHGGKGLALPLTVFCIVVSAFSPIMVTALKLVPRRRGLHRIVMGVSHALVTPS